MNVEEFNKQVNGTKDHFWLAADSIGGDWKAKKVPLALTLLDTVAMTLWVAFGDKLEMKIMSDGCGEEIDILWTADGSEPSFHNFAKISVYAGSVEFCKNSLN